MNDVEIIPALIGDVERMSSCVKKAYQHYVERMGMEPGPMLDDYDNRIPNDYAFVVKDSDIIIGILVLIIDEHQCLLDNVAVDPEFSGRGIGKKLIKFAEPTALEMSFSEIELYTHEAMTENIKIYQKLGYHISRWITEKGFNRIYMAKTIN